MHQRPENDRPPSSFSSPSLIRLTWMIPVQLTADFGPEFLQHIRSHIDRQLRPQLRHRIGRRPVIGIVAIPDRDRSRVTQNLREIELPLTLVRVSPEDLPAGIPEARPSAARPLSEVAR